MPLMRHGDLLVRAASPSDEGECCVCDAVSGRIIDLHTTVADAIVAAHRAAAARHVSVWHEQVDDRGRSLGPPTVLYSRDS